MGTTINISDELWQRLNSLKTADEKTFEDVIKRLLKESKKEDGDNGNR